MEIQSLAMKMSRSATSPKDVGMGQSRAPKKGRQCHLHPSLRHILLPLGGAWSPQSDKAGRGVGSLACGGPRAPGEPNRTAGGCRRPGHPHGTPGQAGESGLGAQGSVPGGVRSGRGLTVLPVPGAGCTWHHVLMVSAVHQICPASASAGRSPCCLE